MTYQEILDILKNISHEQLKKKAAISLHMDEDEFHEIESLEPIGTFIELEDHPEMPDLCHGQLCFTISSSPSIAD